MPQPSPHAKRINRVLDYIDAHLDTSLDLPTLAAIAHASPWHFHRVFRSTMGETLADLVRRRRLEVAAVRLATTRQSALSIALDVGFQSAEVFTRAFRTQFNVTPSAWRNGAHRMWAERRRGQMRKISQDVRNQHQEIARRFGELMAVWPSRRVQLPGAEAMTIELKTFPDMRVAYMRHVGPYGHPGIAEMWITFAAWCAAQGFMRPRRRMYGISQDSPDVTAPEQCRYDACIEVDAGFKPTGATGVQTIAGGRYACTLFSGPAADIHAAWMKFCSVELPAAGHTFANRPPFELYPEDYVVDEKSGAFTCWLCVPIQT